MASRNGHSAEVPEHSEARIAAKLAAGDRPFVTLKAAATLDGKIATRGGESQWITGEEARALGHALRALHDAVLVGVNTALRDDPQLTARGEGTPAQPARIVLDSTCRTPPEARLFANDGVTRIAIAGKDAPEARMTALRRAGVTVWQSPEAHPQPEQFLPWLRSLGIRSILVEGGAQVHAAFIAKGEADALFLFLAGRLMGDAAAPAWCGTTGVTQFAAMPRLSLSPPRRVGEDVLIHGLFSRV